MVEVGLDWAARDRPTGQLDARHIIPEIRLLQRRTDGDATDTSPASVNPGTPTSIPRVARGLGRAECRTLDERPRKIGRQV